MRQQPGQRTGDSWLRRCVRRLGRRRPGASRPVRLFVGTSPNGEDAPIEMAYAASLRAHSSRPVEITWMRQTQDRGSPWHGWNTRQWATPFSGFRWAIAEVCGFRGRAIYTDCDMLNQRDIAELVDVDLHGKAFGARRGQRFGGHEFCVLVIDCERARDVLPPLAELRHQELAHHRCIERFAGNDEVVAEIDARWNCLDGDGRPLDDIWQLHFTTMATQPWRPAWFRGEPQPHPRPELVRLFEHWLAVAREAGARPFAPEQPVDLAILGR